LAELICDTSPLQYLHQLRHLDILPALGARVLVPPAVVDELGEGMKLGLDLPDVRALDWVEVLRPVGAPALPMVTDLGPGESEVLALALELREAVLVLDDRLARKVALTLGLRMTGTLGLLLDAKRVGRIERVAPLLNELESLGFRLADHTRVAVMKLAGEVELTS
jgi:uncharacterized protein